MKAKILFSLLLLISINLKAQQTPKPPTHNDTCFAQQKLLTPDKRLDNIQLNLLKFGRTYATGTTILLVGIGGSILGSYYAFNKTKTGTPIIMFAGVGLTITGGVIQIAAHHFLRLAGGYFN